MVMANDFLGSRTRRSHGVRAKYSPSMRTSAPMGVDLKTRRYASSSSAPAFSSPAFPPALLPDFPDDLGAEDSGSVLATIAFSAEGFSAAGFSAVAFSATGFSATGFSTTAGLASSATGFLATASSATGALVGSVAGGVGFAADVGVGAGVATAGTGSGWAVCHGLALARYTAPNAAAAASTAMPAISLPDPLGFSEGTLSRLGGRSPARVDPPKSNDSGAAVEGGAAAESETSSVFSDAVSSRGAPAEISSRTSEGAAASAAEETRLPPRFSNDAKASLPPLFRSPDSGLAGVFCPAVVFGDESGASKPAGVAPLFVECNSSAPVLKSSISGVGTASAAVFPMAFWASAASRAASFK